MKFWYLYIIVSSLVGLYLLLYHGYLHRRHRSKEFWVYWKPEDISNFNKKRHLHKNKFAKIEDFRFIAGILAKTETDVEFRASATIIAKYWILTTANVAINFLKRRIRKEAWYVCGNSANWTQCTRHPIIKFYIHEKYLGYGEDNRYNIALARTKTPVIGTNVKPIHFANCTYEYEDNSTILALGWDATDVDAEVRYLESELIPLNECKELYRMTSAPGVVTKDMICFPRYDPKFCKLAQGGPVYQNNTLIGIIGKLVPYTDCRKEKHVVISLKLTSFTDWILATVSNYS